jgi:hypothetical protein
MIEHVREQRRGMRKVGVADAATVHARVQLTR